MTTAQPRMAPLTAGAGHPEGDDVDAAAGAGGGKAAARLADYFRAQRLVTTTMSTTMSTMSTTTAATSFGLDSSAVTADLGASAAGAPAASSATPAPAAAAAAASAPTTANPGLQELAYGTGLYLSCTGESPLVGAADLLLLPPPPEVPGFPDYLDEVAGEPQKVEHGADPPPPQPHHHHGQEWNNKNNNNPLPPHASPYHQQPAQHNPVQNMMSQPSPGQSHGHSQNNLPNVQPPQHPPPPPFGQPPQDPPSHHPGHAPAVAPQNEYDRQLRLAQEQHSAQLQHAQQLQHQGYIRDQEQQRRLMQQSQPPPHPADQQANWDQHYPPPSVPPGAHAWQHSTDLTGTGGSLYATPVYGSVPYPPALPRHSPFQGSSQAGYSGHADLTLSGSSNDALGPNPHATPAAFPYAPHGVQGGGASLPEHAPVDHPSQSPPLTGQPYGQHAPLHTSVNSSSSGHPLTSSVPYSQDGLPSSQLDGSYQGQDQVFAGYPSPPGGCAPSHAVHGVPGGIPTSSPSSSFPGATQHVSAEGQYLYASGIMAASNGAIPGDASSDLPRYSQVPDRNSAPVPSSGIHASSPLIYHSANSYPIDSAAGMGNIPVTGAYPGPAAHANWTPHGPSMSGAPPHLPQHNPPVHHPSLTYSHPPPPQNQPNGQPNPSPQPAPPPTGSAPSKGMMKQMTRFAGNMMRTGGNMVVSAADKMQKRQ